MAESLRLSDKRSGERMLKIQEFISCFDEINEANTYLMAHLSIESSARLIENDEGNIYKVTLYTPAKNADMANPLVKEAHCLVLDEYGDLLAKAWDHLETPKGAKKFPTDFIFDHSTTIEHIPEGDTVVVYNVEGRWIIATENDAAGIEEFPDGAFCGLTYATYVKRWLAGRFAKWNKPFLNTNPFMCFTFIYSGPSYKHITPVDAEPELYLMGVMNIETGREFEYSMVDVLANKMNFDRPKRNEINGLSSLIRQERAMDVTTPGLMLRDKHGRRAIVVNPVYDALKNAKAAGDKVHPTHIAKILQTCRDKAKMEDIAKVYEDYKSMLLLMSRVKDSLLQELLDLWNMARTKKDMKSFTDIVRHHPLNYIMYKLKDGRITAIREEIDSINPSRLTELVRERCEKEFESASRLLKFAGGSTHDFEEEEGSWRF